jgi:hypothetical protein
MDWKEILGYFTVWIQAETTIILWAKSGVPLWHAIIYISFTTSVVFLGCYFAAFLTKYFLIEKVYKLSNGLNGFNEKRAAKFYCWIKKQNKWVVSFITVLLFLLLPGLLIALAKLAEIKNSFIVLFVWNSARVAIMCCILYRLFAP